MSQAVRTTRPPFGVSFLVVLGVIQGVIGIFVGFFVIFDREDVDLVVQSQMTPNELLWAGIFGVILGVAVLYLALALGRGSELVRMLFGILTIFHLAAGVWALVALHGHQRYGGAWQVVFSLVVLYILFGSESSKRFFQDD